MYLMLRTWCFFQGVFVFLTCSNVGQIDQIDHDLDNLDPNLPLWHVVQDLCSIDPTQEACPRSCRLYGFHSATWPRSYRSGIDLSVLNDLDHQVEIDDPSQACNGWWTVARALAVARWGCAVYCCVVRSRFSTSKTKKKATCENLGGGVGLSSGTRKTPGNTRNERSKKTTWSHRINCCCSRYVPEARCGRDDPLRRAKLRLIYSKTNTRDAKLQCNRLW